MKKRLLVLAVAVCLVAAAGLSALTADSAAETTAAAYVTAFQKGNWADAKLLSSDAALSFVELVESRKGTTDGFKAIEKVESEQLGDSVRVKVYYSNKDGKLIPRYVKVKNIGIGKNAVVDDKLVGSDWVSNSYSKGLFKTTETIEGVTLSVIGYLQVGDEIKFDLYITNASKLDRYIMPMQESFAVVELDGTFRKRYYALVPEIVTDGLLKAGTSIRTFAIMPYWQKDPAIAGLKGEKIIWIFYLPFGPINQFALEYL
jgi:hypothetical protein